MALGDITQKKLLAKTIDNTPANNRITNLGSNIKTTITSITMKIMTGGTYIRHVTAYLYGENPANELFTIELDPTKTHSEIITQLDYILSNTETMSFKVDTGNDVNIFVMGIQEEIV